MSYKIIRYRKRLFCELGQLFAGYVEYSNSPRGKVLFHKFFLFCKQLFANKQISTACRGRFSSKLPKDEVEILRTKISSTNYSAKSRSLPYAFTEKGPKMVQYVLNGMDEKLFVSTYKLRLPDREQLENFLIKEVKEMGL